MSEFIYKYRAYLSLAICLLLSVILLNTNETTQIQFLRLKTSTLAGDLTLPFQFIPRTLKLYTVNRSLNHQLFLLKEEYSQIQELRLENERLRRMLNFISRTEYSYIPALVINRSIGQTLNSVTLDKGKKQGLKKGAPVLSSSGIVGRLVEVDDNHSLCQLILDNPMGVAVKIQRNRIDGILHWDSGDLCRLDGILHSMDVVLGDTLITSGIGGVFPKGFNVGTVTSVKKERELLFQQIYVKPFTDFHRLEEVFVLNR